MASLGDVFSPDVVIDLAGPRAYARGVAYLRDGRVVPEAGGDGRVRATVRGSAPYTVELWADERSPSWACTCPAAEDGAFCKHCVAVALLYHRDVADPGADDARDAEVVPFPGRDSAADDELTGYVSGLPHDRLVELVLESAASDWRMRERLGAEARIARGQSPDLGGWRQRIRAAFEPDGDFVDYREAPGWARQVHDVIDALGELCDARHPGAVVLLAEDAHRRADEAMQYVDDSDGWLTDISQRLGELHLRACTEGSPDPVALAGRLVELELGSELIGFHRAAADYAEALGDAGLAEYRRLVEPRWRDVMDETDWSPERFALREAMVGVALAGGDPDELIDVRRHDLHVADDYLEIVRVLVDAGRGDEAIDWARRGLAAGRVWQSRPLRDCLAQLLRERGDAGGAVELFWDAFTRAPSVSAYRRLLEESGDEADTWRQRCLELLRSVVAVVASDRSVDGSGSGTTGPVNGEGHRRADPTTWPGASQVLVEILAHEGDIDGAWQAATDHGCDDRMWLTLARAREVSHPLDAIDVYEPEVFALIDRKRNDAYRDAVDLMARIRRLADAAGRTERFDAVLARVRTEHKAKRNLRALLDKRGW